MSMKKECTAEEARFKAEAYCSLVEHCSDDVLRKLEQWGVPSESHEQIIEYLKKERFIDERRYAIAFVRDKYRFNQWGRIKIAYHLKCKHVTQHVIDAALSEIDENEYIPSLEHILQVKMRSLKGKEPILAKASLLRFASSRGFEPNLIYRVLPKFVNCDDEY